MAQSTLPLAIAGTLAAHLIIAVVVDVASVVGRKEDRKPPPKLGLVDIDTRLIKPPEPPPVPEVAPEPDVPDPVLPTQPQVQPQRTTRSRTRTAEPPPVNVAPPSGEPSDDPGGGPVVRLDGIAPDARGVAAQGGKPSGERLGRGGKGKGAGEGDGSGGGSGPPLPVVATSIASIKTPAEAKEGFDYFDASNNYPAEARRLGIEGKLRVRLTVDATGKVSQAKLLGSLGHGLDELAMSRARAIQFKPALDSDNKPVASTVIWTFTFTLPSDT